MRFRHLDASAVLAWLEREGSTIQVLEWERERPAGGVAGLLKLQKPKSAGPALPAKLSDVAFIAGRGINSSHAATVLRFYFHVNSTAAERRPLTLVEAVEHVEMAGEAAEFVLAGHPDGGLISVSRERMAFQEGLAPIDWWGP